MKNHDLRNEKLQMRLQVWQEKLALLEKALEDELEQDHFPRRMDFLLFLDREKRICTSVISELRGLGEGAAAIQSKL
jgi:hypothetical protein